MLMVTVGILLLWVISYYLLERSKTYYVPFSQKRSFGNQSSISFPKVGETIRHNFGSKKKEKNQNSIRFTSLNMERGKQMDKIIEQLQQLNSDIIFLQEVDYFSKRGGRLDQAGEIAKILKMNSFWVCEFEIRDPCNLKDDFNHSHLGCEGNAILSKFPIIESQAVLLDCQQIPKPGHRPYKSHIEAMGVIEISNNSTICVCSVHIDPHYTGKLGRGKQYTQLVQKLIPFLKKYPTVIAGDFNTVCTGIGRVNIPKLSPDWDSALGSLGHSEALVFENRTIAKTNDIIKSECGELSILRDPFDKQKDTTFCGMSGLYNAKLDWCLLSNHFNMNSYFVGNKPEQLCSDHLWITVDAELVNDMSNSKIK